MLFEHLLADKPRENFAVNRFLATFAYPNRLNYETT